MLAIGNGAEQEILEQIKMVGVNNIIVTPILPYQIKLPLMIKTLRVRELQQQASDPNQHSISQVRQNSRRD